MDIHFRVLYFVMVTSQVHQILVKGETCRSTFGLNDVDDFSPHACSWCYVYMFPQKPFKATPDHHLTIISNNSKIPLGTKVFPDVANASSVSSVCATLTTDECNRWTLCCRAANECCKRQLIMKTPTGNETCGSMWDGYSCWDSGTPGITSHQSCPAFLPSSVPTRVSLKTCQSDGSWLKKGGRDWTDYTQCYDVKKLAQGETCRSKFGLFTADDFSPHACSWCYFFLYPQKAFKPTPDHHLTVTFNNSKIPLGTKVFPDVANASSVSSVCATLTTDECDRWMLCCKAATECCKRQLRTKSSTGNDTCGSTWDGYSCWDSGTPALISHQSCPAFLQFSVPTRFSLKTCLSDGNWLMKDGRDWTDYTPCLNYKELKVSIFISLGCQIVSLILLIPAVIIFLHFKSLISQHRIRIHVNFFLSFIVSGVLSILWNMTVTYDRLTNTNITHTAMYKNTAGCKLLSFLKLYSTSTNYLWMFCEGMYLYRLIVNAFSPPKRLLPFYILGWGTPLIFTSVYAILRVVYADESCWAKSLGDKEWIIYAPNLAGLVANIYFLCSILRILLTQLQVHPNEPSNFRKALKATFVLIPLFGVQLVLTVYRLPPESSFSLYYERFSEFVTNSQGMFVALIFCLCNGEVLTLLSHSWRRRRGYEWDSKKGNHSTSMNMTTTVVSRYDSMKVSPTKIQLPCLKSDDQQPTAV